MNELQILLSTKKKGNIIYYTISFVLNGSKEVFNDTVDSRTFEVNSYKKSFIEFFLKNLPYFILKNYEYTNESNEENSIFCFEKELNYMGDLIKQIPILLKENKEENKINIDLKSELEYLTIERLLIYREKSIRHRAKINGLIDIRLIESDFPEYFL